jgi:hypothetical protein
MNFSQIKLKKNSLISLFVFAFLLVYQPFNISRWTFQDVLLYCAGYGLCTFAGLVIANIFLRKLSVEQYASKSAKKQAISSLLHIFIIAVLNFLYSVAIGIITISWQGFLVFFAFTLAVGIFPSLLLFLPYFKKQPSAKVSENSKPTAGSIVTQVQLQGENKDEIFTCSKDELLFIKSELNYCEINYLKNNLLKKYLIRATIKNLEEQITLPSVMRVHRSFLCNLDNVTRHSYKNQKLKLYFPLVEAPVICSRNYYKMTMRMIQYQKPRHSSLNLTAKQ